MKRYLTSTEVADELDITVDALQARIRAGQFVEPDAVTGRVQGWLTSTIEASKEPGDGQGHIIRFDSTKSFEHVAELRNISALVHAYGQADTGAPNDTPASWADKRARHAAVLVSDEIAATAAKLECFTRSVLANERIRAYRIDNIDLDGDKTPNTPVIQEIPIPTPSVTPLIVYLGTINPLEKAQHLRNAADTLEHLATATTPTNRPNRKIATYAAQIRDIAEDIIGANSRDAGSGNPSQSRPSMT